MIRHKPRVSLKHTVEPAVTVAATRVSCFGIGIGVSGISLWEREEDAYMVLLEM
jgi:hypothetical protein